MGVIDVSIAFLSLTAPGAEGLTGDALFKLACDVNQCSAAVRDQYPSYISILCSLNLALEH